MPSSDSIRVLLAVEGLAGDLLERSLREHGGFEVLERTGDPSTVAHRARSTRPDFVVVGISEPGAPCEAGRLFGDEPDVKVVTLETTSGRAVLCELIGDLPPDELVAVLRRAADRGGL
jgi:hypothetical protein